MARKKNNNVMGLFLSVDVSLILSFFIILFGLYFVWKGVDVLSVSLGVFLIFFGFLLYNYNSIEHLFKTIFLKVSPVVLFITFVFLYAYIKIVGFSNFAEDFVKTLSAIFVFGVFFTNAIMKSKTFKK